MAGADVIKVEPVGGEQLRGDALDNQTTLCAFHH